MQELQINIKTLLKSYLIDYLIVPTFNNVNRLFVLSFENENDRISF